MCFFPWVFSCHQIQTTNPEFCDSTKENKKTYLHDETCHLLFSWSSWTRRLSSANALIQRCLICADLATMRNHLLRLLSCILMAFLTLTLYCGSAMKQEHSIVNSLFLLRPSDYDPLLVTTQNFITDAFGYISIIPFTIICPNQFTTENFSSITTFCMMNIWSKIFKIILHAEDNSVQRQIRMTFLDRWEKVERQLDNTRNEYLNVKY